MSTESRCLTPQTLANFVGGNLQGEDRRVVIEHLDQCSSCYESLQWLLEMEELDEREPEDSERVTGEQPRGIEDRIVAPEVNEPALAGSTEHPTLLPPRRHPWPPWAMPTAATLAVATLGTLLWITSHPYVTPVGESFLTKLESANQLAVSSCDGILANFRGPFDPSDEMIASQSNCRGGDNETELTPAALTDALNNAIAELERDEKPALGDVLAAARFCLHPEVRLPASAASLTCRNLERWSSNEELQNLCTWATFRSAGSGDKGQETKREAAARMASLVEKHPKDLSFAFNLASMLTELKDPGAIEAWDRYLELDSSSAWAAEAMKKRAGLEANPTQ